ncbi:MAG: hypothetical protein JW729_06485, partial [Bacteroidales bacterium]|nr:hypothetical protein [Bacteroidales bacterium]
MKKIQLNKLKLPQSFYNYTSYIGSIIAIVGLFMWAFLFALSIFFNEGGAYLGLVIWIVIPGFIVIGL